MPHTQNKPTLIIGALALLAGASLVFILLAQQKKSPNASLLTIGPVRYNCELSGGSFQNERCTCPVENDQSQESMYDKNTGFCQSTIGGPAGDAFNASIGLPHGEYEYWTQIIMGLCTNSGGNISGAACICPSGKDYTKANGKCE